MALRKIEVTNRLFLQVVLTSKELRFSILPKKIEYADFLTQFELLHRDNITFEMKSENRDFLENKLKYIFFCTFKSCSFDQVEKNYEKWSL